MDGPVMRRLLEWRAAAAALPQHRAPRLASLAVALSILVDNARSMAGALAHRGPFVVNYPTPPTRVTWLDAT